MKICLFTRFFCVLVCLSTLPFSASAQEESYQEYLTRRNRDLFAKVKKYVEQDSNVNAPTGIYDITYFQYQVWGFGYYCDTSLFPIVTYMVEKQSPIREPFWFTNDYCPESGHYIFRYVQLLLDNGNVLENKDLFKLVDLYYFTPYGGDYPDLNDLDYYGKTPLMYACAFGNKPLVRYLLQKGADKKVLSSEGKKAFAYCRTKAMKRYLKRTRSHRYVAEERR